MVIEEMLSDEVLQQAAVELAIEVNGNLLVPAECQHCFLFKFDPKMQSFINGMTPQCYAFVLQDPSISKKTKWRFNHTTNLRCIILIYVDCLLIKFR